MHWIAETVRRLFGGHTSDVVQHYRDLVDDLRADQAVLRTELQAVKRRLDECEKRHRENETAKKLTDDMLHRVAMLEQRLTGH